MKAIIKKSRRYVIACATIVSFLILTGCSLPAKPSTEMYQESIVSTGDLIEIVDKEELEPVYESKTNNYSQQVKYKNHVLDFTEGMTLKQSILRCMPLLDAGQTGTLWAHQHLIVSQSVIVEYKDGSQQSWLLVSTGTQEGADVGWVPAEDICKYQETDLLQLGAYYLLRDNAGYQENGVWRKNCGEEKVYSPLCLISIQEDNGNIVLSGWGGITIVVSESEVLSPYQFALPANWESVP